ncbi:hypothetical protein Tco_1465696 [Tanacetum coccineum]
MDSSFTLGSTEEADNVKILQSCNGLLLYSGLGRRVFDYVYNPSINQYKKLPYPDCSLDNSPYYSSAGLRMAFDPTKSPHYKLVDAGRTSCDIDIQIYSSETRKGSLCRDHDFGSSEFTIYEMMIGCYVWMVRYRVDTDDFMTPLPQGWSIQSNVGSIVLGEREQDSFLVINLSGKIDYVRSFRLLPKVLDELMEITGSTKLHKRMRLWIVQEIAEEEGLLKFLRDRCDDLRRKNARRRVLIREMEALEERGVAVDSLESLKQTHARETAKLAALTDAIAESLARETSCG